MIASKLTNSINQVLFFKCWIGKKGFAPLGLEEGREIVLCEWCLFDQRNGKPPGVQRGKDQWLQPYLAPVQGRLWEADRGSHESLQSPPMMMELALPPPPPKPVCLPQGPVLSWSFSPSSTIQAWVAGPLSLHAYPLLSKPVVGPEWWWMGSSSFNTPLRQLISISEAWGGGGEWWTQWFPAISGPGILFFIPFINPISCLKSSVYQTNHIY